MVESFGEAHGTNVLADFPKGFPAGYRERFAAHSAVVDMQHLLSLTEKNPLVMSFYQPLGQVSGQRKLHCKLYHADTPLALSDVLPILENLGLRVLGEFPYRLRHTNGREFWIHDFAFTCRRRPGTSTSSSSTTPCRTRSSTSCAAMPRTMRSTAWC